MRRLRGGRALTRAESEVASAVLRGSSNAEIALERGVSPRTIANQLQAIFRKLSCGSRVQLVAALSPVAEAPSAPFAVARLSPREALVVQCAAAGASNKAIAYDLGVSESTVNALLRRGMRKLGVARRAALPVAVRSPGPSRK